MTTMSVRVELDVDLTEIDLDTLRTDLAYRARCAVELSPHVIAVRHAATVLRKSTR